MACADEGSAKTSLMPYKMLGSRVPQTRITRSATIGEPCRTNRGPINQTRALMLINMNNVILMEGCMEPFLRGRIDLAKSLADGNPLASYADVALILTAVLSACASIRWPGKGIDRKRFIELLVSLSPADLRTSWVSIPALVNQRFISGRDTPYGGGYHRQNFRDDEIDLCLEEARTKYASVPGDQLRKHSYASLIYEWLRCGYAHQYCPHENITHIPPSSANARVSYNRRLSMDGKQQVMMVYFHLDYLFLLADHHLSVLPSTASSCPSAWWIDQG